jgi:hypothetical protein
LPTESRREVELQDADSFTEPDTKEEAREKAKRGNYDFYETNGAETVDWTTYLKTIRPNELRQRRSRNVSTRLIVSLSAAATIMTLLPSYAKANDRDVRATVINPHSCSIDLSTPDLTDPVQADGFVGTSYPEAGQTSRVSVVLCPLPLNNIDLGGTTNDNDMSSFSVLYRDFDGLGERAGLAVAFHRNTVNAQGDLVSLFVCMWQSNINGSTTASSSWKRATVPCAVDLSPVDTYHFTVTMQASTDTLAFAAAFGGIRFP